MEYVYITENNLENRQYYRYAEYGGELFLKAYLKSRKDFLNLYLPGTGLHKQFLDTLNCGQEESTEDNCIQLKPLLIALIRRLNEDGQPDTSVDAILKTFEVRKRLYAYYSLSFKPLDEENYQDDQLYLLFSMLMEISYRKSHNLKYLNAFLKINDLLLSLRKSWLSDDKKEYLQILRDILEAELGFIKKIMVDSGLNFCM